MAWTFARRNELCNYYSTEDPDIILINSHGRKDDEPIKIFNYNVYQKNCLGEANDGTAIAVRKNIKHQIIDDLDENYLAVIVNTTLGPISLGTGYQPPRRPWIPLQSIMGITRRAMPAYFLGDLNAAHTAFGHNRTNAVGRTLYDHMQDRHLMHLGPDFHTYITQGGSGTPDIILCNNRLVHNLQIRPGQLTTSDHLPIIIKIAASPIQVPAPKKYDLRRANWEAFREELSALPGVNLDGRPAAAVDTYFNRWVQNISNALDRHVPKSTHRILPHPRTTALIREIQGSYLTLLQQKDTNGGNWTREYRRQLVTLQQNLQEACKAEREEHWNTLLADTEADYRNPSKFWQDIRRLMGGSQQSSPYILNHLDQKLFSDREKEAEFRRYWEPIYTITEEENRDFCQQTQAETEEYLRTHTQDFSPYDTIDLTRLNAHNYITSPITLNDIKTTINSFKNKKAPGISLINKEILTQLPENMLLQYQDLLNASLSVGIFPSKFKTAVLKFIPKANKTTTRVGNHRPISLLEAAGKVYEKIINKRLRMIIEDRHLNNPRQHSYRQNRGTHTAIALLYEEVSISQRRREQCNVVLRDVSKAFDKVYHEGLKFKILQLQLPRNISALLCNFLDGRTARIQINSHIGEEFQLKSGVPQGSCLSPTLYNLYVADLGEPLQGNYIQYADDITQVVRYPGHSKELCKRRTEAAIDFVNRFETKWKIKTNITKFQIFHPSKTKPRHVEQQGRRIEFAREVRILGLKLNRTGIKPHVEERRNLARTALAKIKRFTSMNARTKLHLYKALVAPHLVYPPVPLNIAAHRDILRLQAVQNKALRWINGDVPPYATTTEDLHRQYLLQPINIKLFKAAKKTWDTLRAYQPEEVERLLEEEETQPGRDHRWWRTAYIGELTPEPAPIYCNNRRRGAIAGGVHLPPASDTDDD